MADAPFSSLQGRKYVNVETFRKSGKSVRTPVWFAGEPAEGVPEELYVYSTTDSGKAKRIRNNARTRVAPCDVRGNVQGDWIEARAEVVTGKDAEHGMQLLNTKYMPWKQLLDFFSLFSRNKRVVFLIRPA